MVSVFRAGQMVADIHKPSNGFNVSAEVGFARALIAAAEPPLQY
jgi:hypothetical protein